jgi:hypothetical protein
MQDCIDQGRHFVRTVLGYGEREEKAVEFMICVAAETDEVESITFPFWAFATRSRARVWRLGQALVSAFLLNPNPSM